MVNVITKTCIHPECRKQPVYNTEGESKPMYCSAHKLEGMVDVKHVTCIHPNCKTRPAFNTEGVKKALYCSAHKLENMINVVNKTCIHPECKTRPVYNAEGQRTGLYCSAHKLEGMVDVKHVTCIHPDCRTLPSYNMEGVKKPMYCSAHKLEGMIDVKNKTCIHPNCKTLPAFNMEGQTTGLYCSAHKLDGMIDVKSKTCKSEWCSTQVQEKYDGYCLFCFMNLFPDKPVARNYKTKEYSVVDHVKTTFPDLEWKTDRTVSGGCSKRRPDMLLDLGYQVLIVEIDENQHIGYDCSCQNKRIMELSQDVGHRPIVFIRFNPDEYEKDGKSIASCWGLDKKGICAVKRSKRAEWSERLRTLEEHIRYWICPANTTSKTVEIIQMYYDD
jgi:hypothetical protein